LSAAVTECPPEARFDTIEQRLAYLRWLARPATRLQPRKAEHQTRVEFLETVWYESRRAGLDPALVLGLIQVESGFRKYAISVPAHAATCRSCRSGPASSATAIRARLFHMQTNLRFGCVILRHYLDIERGDLFLALGRYNGSRGRAEYPNAGLRCAQAVGHPRLSDGRGGDQSPFQACGAAPAMPVSANARSTVSSINAWMLRGR
jgi:soluble lytic murein transglycosylase-like protein